MDKLEHYRQIVQKILTEHGQIQPAYGELQITGLPLAKLAKPSREHPAPQLF